MKRLALITLTLLLTPSCEDGPPDPTPLTTEDTGEATTDESGTDETDGGDDCGDDNCAEGMGWGGTGGE